MTKAKRLSDIKAISFDGDMTLWDFEAVMRNSLAHALARLRVRRPGPAAAAMTIERMITIRNEVSRELHEEGARLEEIRLRAFARTVQACGDADADLAADLNTVYRDHRFADTELYPDVVPALDALAPGYVLGLLSNGNGYPDLCGLPGRFVFVVFAQDVGVSKPDPAIFLAACCQTGIAPHELLHVGDSLPSDVQGANGVGAVSVWLNREGQPNTTGIEPDYEIRSLMELPALLARNLD